VVWILVPPVDRVLVPVVDVFDRAANVDGEPPKVVTRQVLEVGVEDPQCLLADRAEPPIVQARQVTADTEKLVSLPRPAPLSRCLNELFDHRSAAACGSWRRKKEKAKGNARRVAR
jgi:hypothetical protein